MIFGLAKMLSSVISSIVMIDPILETKVRNVINAVQMIGAAIIGILMTYLERYIPVQLVVTLSTLLVFAGFIILSFLEWTTTSLIVAIVCVTLAKGFAFTLSGIIAFKD